MELLSPIELLELLDLAGSCLGGQNDGCAWGHADVVADGIEPVSSSPGMLFLNSLNCLGVLPPMLLLLERPKEERWEKPNDGARKNTLQSASADADKGRRGRQCLVVQ